MSKGSGRRKENTDLVRKNCDGIKWGVNDALKSDSKDKDRFYEEASDLSEEMKLHHDKMELPWFLKRQAS